MFLQSSRLCKPNHLLLKIRPRPNITRGPCLEESWELSQEIETEYLESCNHVVDIRTYKIKNAGDLRKTIIDKVFDESVNNGVTKVVEEKVKADRKPQKAKLGDRSRYSRPSETRRPFQVWPVITVFPDADSRCTEPAVDDPSPSL